jgi:hypothetical protein
VEDFSNFNQKKSISIQVTDKNNAVVMGDG